MKTSLQRLICLMCVITPIIATAQTNIKTAFDAIINCPQVQITESHTLDKNPSTQAKTGQSHIYRFVLPADKINLIKNVVSAINKDSQMAYSINSGKSVNNDAKIYLATGDGNDQGVYINEPDNEYIYALFLAPKSEDSESIYRYAYGINYLEADGVITGKLIITYAMTLQHRQELNKSRNLRMLQDLSTTTLPAISTTTLPSTSTAQKSWLESMISYLQSMSHGSSLTRTALATKAYRLIQDIKKYPEVTETDKDTVREILKDMISNKKYSETVLNNILNQCLTNLK